LTIAGSSVWTSLKDKNPRGTYREASTLLRVLHPGAQPGSLSDYQRIVFPEKGGEKSYFKYT
jgi:hypothetical protein